MSYKQNCAQGEAHYQSGTSPHFQGQVYVGEKTVAITYNDTEGANASLIAEAFNILAETGMTPRELAHQRAMLLGALDRLAPMFNNDSKLLDVYENEIQYAQALLAAYKTP